MKLISPNFSDLMEPNIEIKEFPDGDSYVRIPDIEKCRDSEVVIYHRLYPDQNKAIFNLLQMLDTLGRVNASVTVVAPYVPYSRQDKLFKDGEVLSSELLCSLLAKSGVKKLVTLDCHFLKKEGDFTYAGLKITNISANRKLIEHAGSTNLEVMSPDAGANYLVSDYGGKSMEKVRGEYQEGDVAYRTVDSIKMNFDVKGKDVLILDDMISTGGTMIKAVENVRKGGARKVICAATHGFFLKESLSRLSAVTDDIYTTNSIPNEAAKVNIMDLIQL